MTTLETPDAHEGFELSFPSADIAAVRIATRPLGVMGVAAKLGLLALLKKIDENKAVRVVVITGSGKVFSVGSDIKEFERSAGYLLSLESAENAVNDFIETMRVPVIAAINGHAYGAGLVLALACDIRLAARSAEMGLPEVKVGTFASASGTQRLPRLIGRGKALLMLLTGRTMKGEQAFDCGLVEQVCDDDALLDEALALADEIAAASPEAVQVTKQCVNKGLREGWHAGMLNEAVSVVTAGLSEDALEGQRAFLEKRDPVFR